MGSQEDRGRISTRDTERTRRAILTAASRLIAHDGLGVAIGAIATAAGVSKSGLLHHFPSRDALIEALTREMTEEVRRGVYERVDLAENRPGKLLRAYVRAMCDDIEWMMDSDSHDDLDWDWGAWVVLRSTPSATTIGLQDARRWERELTADGLDRDRVLLVQLAADGLCVFAQHDEVLARGYLSRMRPLLLGLTEDSGPLVPRPPEHSPSP